MRWKKTFYPLYKLLDILEISHHLTEGQIKYIDSNDLLETWVSTTHTHTHNEREREREREREIVTSEKERVVLHWWLNRVKEETYIKIKYMNVYRCYWLDILISPLGLAPNVGRWIPS